MNSEIQSAWDAALDAAKQYGDYVSAMHALPADIEAAQSSGGSYGLGNTNYDSSSTEEEQIRAIVRQMKANSEMWHKASNSEKQRLSERNQEYADELAEKFGLHIYRGSDGVWYMMDGSKLYDKYGVYHSGGIVGGLATPKQNETMALLENGEAVYTQTQQRGLERIISLMSKMTGGIGSGGFLGGDSVLGTMLARLASNNVSGSGSGVQIGQLNVNAPIHVVKELNDEEIRRHSRIIGSISAEYIKEGFTKHGVKAPVAII